MPPVVVLKVSIIGTGLNHHWNLIKIRLTNQEVQIKNFVSLGGNLEALGRERSWKLHALSICVVCDDASDLKGKSKRPKTPSNHSGQRRK